MLIGPASQAPQLRLCIASINSCGAMCRMYLSVVPRLELTKLYPS